MANQTTYEDDADIVASEAFIQLLKSGGTLGDAYWRTTTDEREALYQMAYGLYEQGRYSDALKLFSSLVMQDHHEPRYLFALGSTCQVLGRHTDALQHYMAAAVENADDPLPIFHAAECLIAMHHFSEAIDSLVLVIELCPDKQSALHNRAKVLLQGLQTAQQQTTGAQDEHL